MKSLEKGKRWRCHADVNVFVVFYILLSQYACNEFALFKLRAVLTTSVCTESIHSWVLIESQQKKNGQYNKKTDYHTLILRTYTNRVHYLPWICNYAARQPIPQNIFKTDHLGGKKYTIHFV